MRVFATIAMLSFLAVPAMSEDLNPKLIETFQDIAYFKDPADLNRCTHIFKDALDAKEFGSFDREGFVYKKMRSANCFDKYADFGHGALSAGYRTKGDPLAKELSVSLQSGVLVIRLNTFDNSIVTDPEADIRNGLRALGDDWPARTQRIYFDLRGNEGGIIDLARDVIELFAPRAGINFMHLDSPAKTEAEKLSTTYARGILAGYPLTFLVDGATCSSAELVVSTVHDWDTASAIVGSEHTCGKAIVQQINYIGHRGFLLKVTSGHWITEHDWNHVGIQPTRIADLDRCKKDYLCIDRMLRAVRNARGE